MAESCSVADREIFEILLAREKLGSTGVGNGIAIPHGKIKNLDRLRGYFARLERPVEFDAVDERPVDLIFLLWCGITGLVSILFLFLNILWCYILIRASVVRWHRILLVQSLMAL